MKESWRTVLVALALICCQADGKSQVSFLDASSARLFLKQSPELRTAGKLADLSAFVTSLLRVNPVTRIDRETSGQITGLLKDSPFDKPEAVALFSIAAAPTLAASFDLANAWVFEGAHDEGLAKSQALLTRAGAVERNSLDISSLSGCGEVCVESMLQEALIGLGLDGNYTAANSGPLKGTLTLRSSAKDQEFSLLNLNEVPDRLFAVEFVSTWRAALNAAEDKQSRVQQGLLQDHPQLIQRTFVSLQFLAKAYGSSSAQYRAAWAVLQKLISSMKQLLSKAYNERIVFVLVSFDEKAGQDLANLASVHSSGPKRRLLAEGDTPEKTDKFIAWIAMWCTFFLLLFFAVAGCHCLKNMRFKQDSLLYGKSKAQ